MAALLRRAFGAALPMEFARTPDGTSTQVYRIARGGDVFYLRLAEESHEDLRTDAAVHRELLRRGVPVPDVVYVEPFDRALGRSAMLTTEIPGIPLPADAPRATAVRVARAAGRACARLNEVRVEGFGWIRRDGRQPLSAKLAGYPQFVRSELPVPWPGRLALVFAAAELDALHDLVEAEAASPLDIGRLAHGDLDVTHLFTDGCTLTGIIDLGELRGAEPWYDLGHFHLHDRQLHPLPLLPHFLAGYAEITPVQPDHEELIRRSAVLSGLRQLCRWLGRDIPPGTPVVDGRVARIRELIGQPRHRQNGWPAGSA